MRGFFSWFKASIKMKRWIFTILIGIILACYGVATILVTKEMSFIEIGKIIAVFVVGFTLIILGIVFTQKRTLELLIEASDLRLEKGKKNINIHSLIFNKKVFDKGPKVVVIGGGSGLNTVLKGIKNYTSNITAIVTVSDYGKMPTNSRKELGLLPSDDIKDSIISLAYDEDVMASVFQYEFSKKLEGLNFGDIYLSAMKNTYGDFSEAIYRSPSILNMAGKVLPVTLDEMKICAELENGMIVEEKSQIPAVVFDKVTKISRMYLSPSNCKPANGVLEAIKEADAIIIGPGSLYTNVIPNLLVKNVAKTIKESKAIKIYVNNIMTEPGQTDNYSISEHLQAIMEHAGEGVIDYCIYDTGEIVPEFVRKYNREGQDLVEQDTAKAKEEGVKLLQRNLSYIDGEFIRHNPDAIASSIIELVCEDMKFRDMENDSRYVMLNSKLKDTKKKLKKTTAKPKKEKLKHTKNEKLSKFAMKYQDRIDSIKQSDEKTQKRKEEKIKQRMRREENATTETKIEKIKEKKQPTKRKSAVRPKH